MTPYSVGVAISQPRGKRALDRILDESFVADLSTIPLQELRERRLLADHEEAWLSYTRRMLHGRIDILEAKAQMRKQGLEDADPELDIDALVQSLAGQMGQGNRHVGADVVDSPGGGRRAVERLIARSGLDEYSSMTDEQLFERLDSLRDMEQEVSEARNQLHDVQELLTAELAQRYRRGEARPEIALGQPSGQDS